LKYDGKIDFWNFYRGRFLRLWPMIFCWIFVRVIIEGGFFKKFAWDKLSCLIFINNWLGTGDQGWSLAVEFQFYLISPWLVYWMAKSSRPIMMPIVMTIICVVLRGIFTAMACPPLFNFSSTTADLGKCNFGIY
jgi:peptidoglycan/LPS O-acetylase OafA/YrhL